MMKLKAVTAGIAIACHLVPPGLPHRGGGPHRAAGARSGAARGACGSR